MDEDEAPLEGCYAETAAQCLLSPGQFEIEARQPTYCYRCESQSKPKPSENSILLQLDVLY